MKCWTTPELLREVERRASRDRQKERGQKRDWYALLYGVLLREQGYAPDEAAALVIERYPHTRERLLHLVGLSKAASA